MQMVSVSSSNIASIGYEDNTLYIQFNSGGLYSYCNVPLSVYNSLMSADSKGKYFHAHIKDYYSYKRLG